MGDGVVLSSSGARNMLPESYDPLDAPDPAEWLTLDEGERILLVEQFHREAGLEVQDETLHATVHVIVENQIAEGVEPVVRTLTRLMREGLDRHDALHAIGCILAELLHGIATGELTESVGAKYYSRVERLTAKRWLRGEW